MNIILEVEQDSPVPIYQQIITQIKSAVLDGRLEDGQKLLPIRGLAKQLQVNPSTVARAFQELEREGYIESAGPNGSFARHPGGIKNWQIEFKNAVTKAKNEGATNQQLVQYILE